MGPERSLRSLENQNRSQAGDVFSYRAGNGVGMFYAQRNEKGDT
jgi:hypothetical protein